MQRIYDLRLLKAIAEQKLANAPGEDGLYAYGLSLYVIMQILDAAFDQSADEVKKADIGKGTRWVSDHILDRNPHIPYWGGGPENKGHDMRFLIRVIELGELLYNLQRVPGVHKIFQRLVLDVEKTEDTILELEGLRLLVLAGLPFRLVQTSEPGRRHECDIKIDEETVASCEMKCKIESTGFSTATVENTLEKARKQLPKNSCGIILMKIPIRWGADQENHRKIFETIGRFFTKTTRVAEVILYEWGYWNEGGLAISTNAINQQINPNSPFFSRIGKGIIHTTPDFKQRSEKWLSFGHLNGNTLQHLLVSRGV